MALCSPGDSSSIFFPDHLKEYLGVRYDKENMQFSRSNSVMPFLSWSESGTSGPLASRLSWVKWSKRVWAEFNCIVFDTKICMRR